jgi:hypothetical protein
MNPYDPIVLPTKRMAPKTNCTMTVLSETEAKKRLLEWNFDPDDVTKETNQWYGCPLRKENSDILDYDQRLSRPLIIFSQLGDIPMLRYILQTLGSEEARNEELAQMDEHGLFPLYVAIARGRKEEDVLSVCQWLYKQGANIHQTLGDEYSPLFRACAFGYDQVALWLLSEGALLTDDKDSHRYSFDMTLVRRDLPPSSHSCDGWFRDRTIRKLFAWANETMCVRNNFMLFLSGAFVVPPISKESAVADSKKRIHRALTANGNCSDAAVSLLLNDISDQTLAQFWKMTKATSSLSPLSVFNSHPGIMEHIGKLVGVETKGRMLCTAHGLVEYEKLWIKE